MKLKSVQVTNFRSVDDSTKFDISEVTCLVGKNESGKTTILQAIERLNPYDSTHMEYDRTRDYPRKHLTDYEERHGGKPAQVVYSVWGLEDAEVAALEKTFGVGCLTSRDVVFAKGYAPGTPSHLPIDEEKVLKHLLDSAGCSDEEKTAAAHIKTAADLHAHLTKLGDGISPNLKAVLARLAALPQHSLKPAMLALLPMPKFMYFSNYHRMNGDVSIEQLKQDIAEKKVAEGDSVFMNFLRFAGTTLDDLAKADKYEELIARVEAASIKITQQIFEYWSQNKYLKVRFTIDAGKTADPAPFNTGTIMRARIYNGLHEMTVPFSDRSAGFIWFFSFLVAFSQVKKDHGNVVILLDEPGLNLHGRAQGDLLRYIQEKLMPNHQVIFSTHSPFMVPTERFDWVRTVEDVVVEELGKPPRSLGTKVSGDILSTDRDTLFPLQAALGYEITQSLFVGEHTLLVEGPGDILFLSAASSELLARGKVGLDKRWVVCPAGGVDKVAAFLSLFGGNRLHVAVLVDYAKGQKAKVDHLRKSKLLQDGHVFTVTDFVSEAEGDIEDLFGAALYVEIVNAAFSLSARQQLAVSAVSALAPETPRILKKVEAAFMTLPASAPEFDHYSPARWLIENPATLKAKTADVDAALGRFEALFKKLNALLPKK